VRSNGWEERIDGSTFVDESEGWEASGRDEPTYRGDQPARYVLRRLINFLMNQDARRSEEEWNQHWEDHELAFTITHEPPPRPADLPTKFPTKDDDPLLDQATTEWLNASLDAEMKGDLIDLWAERLDRGGDPDVRWVGAIHQAKSTNSDVWLLALLRDPRETIPPWVRKYLADRIKGRGPGRPRKSQGQVIEDDDDDSCWAEKDARRLKVLLLELYRDAPKRASGNYPSIAKVARKIAAARWGITPEKLEKFTNTCKNRRPQLPR
jgi:hypothetical protein